MKNGDYGIGEWHIAWGPFLVTGNGISVDDLKSHFDDKDTRDELVRCERRIILDYGGYI